nr:unnamed protein product [Callosobruchus chinensis]
MDQGYVTVMSHVINMEDEFEGSPSDPSMATNGGNTNIEAPLQELHNTRDHMETSPMTAGEINTTPYAESYGTEQDKLHRIIADQAAQITDQAAQIKRLTDCVESLNTQDHMTHLCPQTGQEVRKCANCGGDHPANSLTCRFTSRRNLQVIAQRQTISYADAAKVASLAAPAASSSPSTAQSVDLAVDN